MLSNAGANSEAFVSALWEVIHFVLVLISLYLENGFQSFHTQPPILRVRQGKKKTTHNLPEQSGHRK